MGIAPRVGAAVLLLVCGVCGADASRGSSPQKPPTASRPDNPAAPEVVVVSPYEEKTVVESPYFTFVAVVYSLTQNMNVEIRLTLANAKGSEAKVLPARQKEEVAYRLTLAPGENVLTVTAANEKAVSKPVTKVIVYEPRDKKQDDLVYLGIGVSKNEGGQQDLAFAAGDAQELSRLFLTQKGGPVFDDVEPAVITDAEATRSNILRSLHWLKDKADEPEDVAVIFFEGHLSRGDSGNYYLFASGHNPKEDPEIGGVDLTSVMHLLSEFQSRVVLILAGRLHGGVKPVAVGRTLPSAANVIIISAFAEEGVELGNPGSGQGVFASALFEGLSGRADANSDGFVRADELMNWLKRSVAERTRDRLQPAFSAPASLTSLRIFFNSRGRMKP